MENKSIHLIMKNPFTVTVESEGHDWAPLDTTMGWKRWQCSQCGCVDYTDTDKMHAQPHSYPGYTEENKEFLTCEETQVLRILTS